MEEPLGGRRKTRKISKYGSRSKVMHGNAEKTTGGLTKEHLMYNSKGRIVSKKRHATMKQRHSAYGGDDSLEE